MDIQYNKGKSNSHFMIYSIVHYDAKAKKKILFVSCNSQ